MKSRGNSVPTDMQQGFNRPGAITYDLETDDTHDRNKHPCRLGDFQFIVLAHRCRSSVAAQNPNSSKDLLFHSPGD